MKAKHLLIVFLTTFAFYACDDNTGDLGLGMLPPSDDMEVAILPYKVETKSILSGPVFAKTDKGYLGKYSDPDFGFYETEFMTQFSCTGDFMFPEVYSPENPDGDMVENKIKRARFRIYYSDFFGDPKAPCRINIYKLNKDLRLGEDIYYTDFNPEGFYNENDLIVSEVYAAGDSVILTSSGQVSSYFLEYDLPQEFGQNILETYREHPEYFKSPETFVKNVFKGVYLKNESGDGSILYVDWIDLTLFFDMYFKDEEGNILKKTTDGTDSIMYNAVKSFSSTKEVIQAHRFTNSDKLQEKVDENGWTYIKSPAGILTEVTLPIEAIAKEHAKDTLNTVSLMFSAYSQEREDQFSMKPPTNIMMIPKNKVEDFFEQNKLPDSRTTFYTTFSTSGTNANQYNFTNISNLITTSIREKENAKKEAGTNWNETEWIEKNEWGKVVLIPITIQDDGSVSNPTMIGVYNDLKPSYVRLKGGSDALEMKVLYTRFPSAK